MNSLRKLYCRTFQTVLKISIPFLPYRNPHLDTPGFCADFAELETALDLTGHDPARAGKF